ncbi:MAG: AMP-binding protein [Planctomycetota bacterium]
MEARPLVLADLLTRIEARSETFARSRSTECSGSAFASSARRLGRRLRAVGVQPGARVCAYLEHDVELAQFPFACAEAGAVAVIVNPRSKDAQVQHVVADSGASHVLTTAAKALTLADPRTAFGTARVLVDRGPVPAWAEALGEGERDGVRDHDPDAPAILLYTSGSTGRSKGIVQSQRSLCDGARIVAGYLALNQRDDLCAVLPLSFDYGLNQVLSAAFARARVTLTDYLTAGDLLRSIARSGCTGFAGVPEIFVDLVAALDGGKVDPRSVQTLRYVTNSGGRLPERVIRALHARLPWVQVFSMYGLTEAFRSSFVPPEMLASRPRSVGRAIPEVELLVVDPASGREMPRSEIGELVHCGACVARGYWNRPEDTARRFRPHPILGSAGGTCVFSGDLARMDGDGFVELVGRADEQIKVGGYRVSPDEVVDVVRRVSGVRSAAAVGVPHGPDGIPALAVALVADDRATDAATLCEAVRNECRRVLPPWMVPGLLRVVAALPRGPNEKIDLAAVRALFASRDEVR